MPPEETHTARSRAGSATVSRCGPSTCVARVSSWPSRVLGALGRQHAGVVHERVELRAVPPRRRAPKPGSERSQRSTVNAASTTPVAALRRAGSPRSRSRHSRRTSAPSRAAPSAIALPRPGVRAGHRDGAPAQGVRERGRPARSGAARRSRSASSPGTTVRSRTVSSARVSTSPTLRRCSSSLPLSSWTAGCWPASGLPVDGSSRAARSSRTSPSRTRSCVSCSEELAIDVRAVRFLGAVIEGELDLRLWLVELMSGTPTSGPDHRALRWVGATSWTPWTGCRSTGSCST